MKMNLRNDNSYVAGNRTCIELSLCHLDPDKIVDSLVQQNNYRLIA